MEIGAYIYSSVEGVYPSFCLFPFSLSHVEDIRSTIFRWQFYLLFASLLSYEFVPLVELQCHDFFFPGWSMQI